MPLPCFRAKLESQSQSDGHLSNHQYESQLRLRGRRHPCTASAPYAWFWAPDRHMASIRARRLTDAGWGSPYYPRFSLSIAGAPRPAQAAPSSWRSDMPLKLLLKMPNMMVALLGPEISILCTIKTCGMTMERECCGRRNSRRNSLGERLKKVFLMMGNGTEPA